MLHKLGHFCATSDAASLRGAGPDSAQDINAAQKRAGRAGLVG